MLLIHRRELKYDIYYWWAVLSLLNLFFLRISSSLINRALIFLKLGDLTLSAFDKMPVRPPMDIQVAQAHSASPAKPAKPAKPANSAPIK